MKDKIEPGVAERYHSNSILLNKFHKYSIISSVICVAAGIIVLVGWAAGNETLKSILPGFATMKVNTALLFIFSGIALFLYNSDKVDKKKSELTARGFSVAVIIVSLLEILEYVTGMDFHIDQIFIRDILNYSTLAPAGRMALVTAINFLLAGISLLLIRNETVSGKRLFHFTALLIVFFSGIALIGYIYNAESLYTILLYSAIALHTSVLFLFLSTGIISSRPDISFMSLITGNYFSNIIVRKLLPFILIFPVVLGWIRLMAQRAGYFDLEFGLAFMVLLFIVSVVSMLLWNARTIYKLEVERENERLKLSKIEEDIDLYNNAPCGYHSLDRDGLVIQINDTELNWLGYSRDEVINKIHFRQLLTEKGLKIFSNNFDDFQIHGYLNNLELEMIRKDGSTFPILVNAMAIYDTNNNYIKSRSTIFDLTEQKRFQQSILEANERFSKVFLASPLAMAVTSLTGIKISDVNDMFLHLFEYKRNEVVGQTAKHLELFPGQDELYGLMSIQMDNSILRNYEIKMKTRTGKILNTLLSSAVVEIDGLFYQVLMIYDITDRKKDEEELYRYRQHLEKLVEDRSDQLKVQAEQYRILFDSNPLPMWVYDIETLKFLAVNDAAVMHYMYSREEFLNMSIKDIRPAEEIPIMLNNIENAIPGTNVGIMKHRKKDGSIIYAEISFDHVDFEGRKGVLISSSDITVRKLAEQALKKAEERFRTTLDCLLEGCQIIDYGYKYVYVNEVAAKHGHTTIDALIGKSMMELYPGIENSDMYTKLKSCMEGRSEVYMENQFVYPDGNTAWFYLSMEPVPEGVFILSEDITKEKQMDEELKKYREHLEELVMERTVQLEAVNKELEAFSYSVSHDLRAPLRHIDGFIKILGKEISDSLNEKNKRYFENITTSVEKMGVLIDDLLAFSRMGRVEMNKRPVDLNVIVSDVLFEFNSETEKRNIQWIIGSLPEVIGDPSMLKQVFFNLISNALKFTKNKELAVIEIGFEPGTDVNTFYVRDNGAGFDMKYADKLFGVFQRLHSFDEFEGTGIGLANIKRIISRHGGRIWTEGKVDKGASFYFTLPFHNHS